MPTPTKGARLGGSSAHQRHMLANLATALFEHGKITTTEARARRLRPYAERLITFAKRGDLHARRQVLTVVTDKSVVHTLFAEIGPSFANRDGGYTRITKVGPRKGDNAALAVIELIREEPDAKPRRRRARRAPAAGGRWPRATQASCGAERSQPTMSRDEAARDREPTAEEARPRRPRPTRLRRTTPTSRTPRPTRPPTRTRSDAADGDERPTSNSPAMDEPGQQPLTGLVRLRLDLGYDGTEFHGWATQPGLRTVQQVVEEALWRSLRLPEPPALTVAGRTDAGVHARGQVAHADVPAAAWADAPDLALTAGSRGCCQTTSGSGRSGLPRRALMPGSRRCGAATPTGSATTRLRADPLRRRDTLWYRHPLDLDLMNAAALACQGEHDFAAFCRRREGATTIREVIRLDWARTEPGLAVGTVTADAFCHNMVRALTGALLAVGDGSRPVSWFAEVLAARRRDPAVRVAPPHPLCLEEVAYPAAAGPGRQGRRSPGAYQVGYLAARRT